MVETVAYDVEEVVKPFMADRITPPCSILEQEHNRPFLSSPKTSVIQAFAVDGSTDLMERVVFMVTAIVPKSRYVSMVTILFSLEISELARYVEREGVEARIEEDSIVRTVVQVNSYRLDV